MEIYPREHLLMLMSILDNVYTCATIFGPIKIGGRVIWYSIIIIRCWQSSLFFGFVSAIVVSII